MNISTAKVDLMFKHSFANIHNTNGLYVFDLRHDPQFIFKNANQ